MKDKMIIEGNKLIAEFMGYETHENWEFWITGSYIEKFDWYSPGTMKFHNDWNWIMPVVEKIESKNYAVTITQNICIIQASIMGDCTTITRQSGNYDTPNTKIHNTWLAVIEFINWYNKNK